MKQNVIKNIESLDPDPVLEAIVEMRFDTDIPESAIAGVLYTALKDIYPKLEQLPISQLPEIVRNSDPNFKYKPTHKLSSEANPVFIQFGTHVLSINIDKKQSYIGWKEFSAEVFKVANLLSESAVSPKFSRVGVRYISFFESINIFNESNLNIDFNYSSKITDGNTSFISEIKDSDITTRLSLQNNATLHKDNMPLGTGSVVDIDSYALKPISDFTQLKRTINDCHDKEKEIFFSLLKDDFLNSLNPKYKKGK